MDKFLHPTPPPLPSFRSLPAALARLLSALRSAPLVHKVSSPRIYTVAAFFFFPLLPPRHLNLFDHVACDTIDTAPQSARVQDEHHEVESGGEAESS